MHWSNKDIETLLKGVLKHGNQWSLIYKESPILHKFQKSSLPVKINYLKKNAKYDYYINLVKNNKDLPELKSDLTIWDDTDILILSKIVNEKINWEQIIKDNPSLLKYDIKNVKKKYQEISQKKEKYNIICKCNRKHSWKKLLETLECDCGISIQDFINYIQKNYKGNLVWVIDNKVYKILPKNISLTFDNTKLMTVLDYHSTVILFGQKLPESPKLDKEIPNESFCMKFNYDNNCRCKIKCCYRLIYNKLLNKPIFTGLPETSVAREYLKSRTQEYNTTSKCSFTKNFFVSLLKRNTTLKKNSIVSYTYIISKIFEYNLQEVMWNPFYIISLNLPYEIIRTFKNILFLLSDCELYQLYGAKSYTMRDEYSRANKVHQDSKLKTVQKNTDNTNWCSVNDLKTVIDLLEKDFKSIYEYQMIVWLKLEIYLHCLRNEYSTLKLSDYNRDNDNFIIFNKDLQTFTIILNDYKTVGNHGQVVINICSSHIVYNDILNLFNYRLKTDSKFLFLTLQNKQFTQPEFSKFVISFTFKYLSKRIGSRLIRKIIVTETLGPEISLTEKIELAQKMLHTTGTQQTYRKII